MMAGSPTGVDFVKQLSAEAFASRAVNHPYLSALRNGEFPDNNTAFKEFALQYGVYSGRFVFYLSSVIDTLSDPHHKQVLRTNLAEECGDTHGVDLPADVYATIDGQPHAALFRRFQEALAVNDELTGSEPACQAGKEWSQRFSELCKVSECVGVGAIGFGTELIVSRIYGQILEGLKKHTSLTQTERVFFDLHSQCDDEHGAQLLRIAENLAVDQEACEQLAHGMRVALALRETFWDVLLERARQHLSSECSEAVNGY